MKLLVPSLAASLGVAALAPGGAWAARPADVVKRSIAFTGASGRALAEALQLPLDTASTADYPLSRLPRDRAWNLTASWHPQRSELRIEGAIRDMTTASPRRDGPVCEFQSPIFAPDEIETFPEWKPLYAALGRVAPVSGQAPVLDTRKVELPLDGDQRAVLTLVRMQLETGERLAILVAFGPPMGTGPACGTLGRPLK